MTDPSQPVIQDRSRPSWCRPAGRLRHLAAVLAVGLTLAMLVACGTPPPAPAPVATPPAGTPRLLLYLVIDQGAYDHLVRFRPLFSGGLKRLLDQGVSFTAMHHDHAPTETAPGHATLATGCFPAHHGVVGNGWYDRQAKKWIEAVDDPEDDLSPRALEVPALGDWLKERYPQARVFSVSAKDRAAIFTGGLHPDGAFWLDRDTGRFETSEYYADALPAWLEDFNRQDWLGGFFGTSWEPLPAVAEVLAAGTYGIAEVPTAPVADRFPHRLGTVSLGPDEAFYYSVTATPLTDTYVGRMAAAMLAGERLGTDDVPDLLGVSFSLTDIVGHRFGSDSPEILDTLLRLDQTLGELLDAVDAQVGLEHTLVSLSADHGALGNPEHLAAGAHPEAGRYSPEVVRCVQATARSVEETLGHGRWTAQETYLDRAALATAGLDRDRVEADLAQALEACPRIEQVWTEAELRSPAVPGEDPAGELYRHSFHPERSPDLTLQETRFTLAQPTVVSGHGSPYDYDTHVPWIVRLPSGLPGVVDTPAKTVDVAPSLARWLGIEPPPDLDGVDRTAIVEATAKARKPETATVAAP